MQVKSTSKNTALPKLSVTYSSLLSLIQFNGPAFIVMACYGDAITPHSAYVMHLTEERAIKILTAMRKKEVESPGFQINKARATITFTDDCRMSSLDGACLRRKFEESLSGPYLDYVKNKAKWLQKIEIDSTLLRFNVRLENEKALEGMANCFLGYEQPFNVSSVMFNAPMGIPEKKPEQPTTFGPTTIKPLEEELPKATVYLSTAEYAPRYAFDAVIYATPKIIPMKFAAMRIKTALFEIIFRPEGLKLDFKMQDLCAPALKAPLKELHGLLSYLNELLAGGTAARLEVRTKDGSQGLNVSLNPSSISAPDDASEVHAAFHAGYQKFAALGLSDSFFAPSILFSKLNEFQMLRFSDQTFTPSLVLTFQADSSPAKETNVVVFKSTIELEGNTAIFFSAFYGSLEEISEKTLRGSFTRSELIGQFVVPANADISTVIKEQGERCNQLLKDRGFIPLD